MIELNLKSLLLTMVFAISSATWAVSDKIVATVDGEPILQSQVEKVLKASRKKNTVENRAVALNKVIDDIVIAKTLKKAKINLDQSKINQILAQEVDRQIRYIASRNGMSYGAFIIALTNQGINLAQYKAQISRAIEPQLKQQILYSALRDYVMKDEVERIRQTITHEEVSKLAEQMEAKDLKNGKNTNVIKKEYKVSHILLTTNPLLNDAKASKELETIRQQILTQKTTFADAALKYSKDYLSGADGGDLGYRLPDIYDPVFANKVKQTPIGQISKPFKSSFGWHILKVEGQRDKNVTKDVYLDYAFQKLMREKLGEVDKNWIQLLRKENDVQIISQ